jgi:hypothetical protein
MEIPQELLDLAKKYRADHPECTSEELLRYLINDEIAEANNLLAHCITCTCEALCEAVGLVPTWYNK